MFQNASVGMPIMSTNCLAKEGHDITYRATDGYITNVQHGKHTPFIERDGVYFYQLRIPKAAFEKHNRGLSGTLSLSVLPTPPKR